MKTLLIKGNLIVENVPVELRAEYYSSSVVKIVHSCDEKAYPLGSLLLVKQSAGDTLGPQRRRIMIHEIIAVLEHDTP